MSYEPILIAAPTRCGTTMLAWLLHLHGVWIGDAKVTKAPETNPQVGTENTQIKQYLKHPDGNFKEQINKLTPDDQPFLIKTAANLIARDHWIQHFPDALWLLPIRSLEDIVRSKMRHPGMAKQGEAVNRRRTINHLQMQNDISKRAKNVKWITVDFLCQGGPIGRSEARKAVEYCGLEFNPSIYDGWVQPERWNRK